VKTIHAAKQYIDDAKVTFEKLYIRLFLRVSQDSTRKLKASIAFFITFLSILRCLLGFISLAY